MLKSQLIIKVAIKFYDYETFIDTHQTAIILWLLTKYESDSQFENHELSIKNNN
jgi:hypothetical protein